jgi:hypothetical protein
MTGPDQREWAELNRMVGGLVASVHHLTTVQKEHQESSDEGRRRLYDRFESLANQVNGDLRIVSGTISGIATRVDSLASRITAVEPTAQALKDEDLRRQGGMKRSAQLALWCTSGASLMLGVMHEALAFFRSGTPPHGP